MLKENDQLFHLRISAVSKTEIALQNKRRFAKRCNAKRPLNRYKVQLGWISHKILSFGFVHSSISNIIQISLYRLFKRIEGTKRLQSESESGQNVPTTFSN